jgi:KDO2-lipid IV(A) lauroyltransferase
MEKVGYISFRILIFIFRLFPFWLLYLLSDFLFFMFFYIVKYRREVVFSNLRNSFPKKPEKEIFKIAKGFYHNLSDITVESIKGLTMSKKELVKRYKVINLDFEKKIFEQGRGVIALGSHYANWEWGVLCFSLQFSHEPYGLYKPLSNKLTDNYIRKSRAAWGMNLVPINETYSHFQKTFDKPPMHIMVSDQSPSNLKKAYWINFLNQETPCLHGAESYAKQTNLPIIYGDVQRVKRGYYEVTIMPVVDNPKETKDGEITKKFHEILENIIIKKPENWLWSHKRWKHKRKNIS